MTGELLGRIVLSKAGRDKGRRFVVIAIEDDAHVRIADGGLRKIARAKKKKLKHLRIEPVTADAIAAKLNEGARVFDAEIRKYILSLGYNVKPEQ